MPSAKLWRRRLAPAPALVAALALCAAPPHAQAPAQRHDEEFARLVDEWTTRPDFISPLVDRLPIEPGIPTPKEVLGYWIGAPETLTYTADQQRYFRALEAATPRVRTLVIGESEEGREIMVVFVSSEANIANLEQNRRNMRRLADPRGLTETEARDLIARTRMHYHVSAGLHSSETSPPETVMELAYRLAVSDEPYIEAIRDNVILSISPTTDLDGRDRYVDWYYAYKIHEPYEGGENYGGPPYWGKYVFHDNNRDINYGVDSLRAHLEWYLHWVPPIWHDLHEVGVLLYTFSGQPPQNPNLDPVLYTELPFFANYEVNRLTGYGMPGVWHFGFVDMWSPGYLGFAASNHNGMLRMYEIFNVGGANRKKVNLDETRRGSTTREWYRPLPAAGEFDWNIRNSVNYAQTGLLTALDLTSQFGPMLLENFYKKSRNSIEDGRTTAPHAFAIPAGQRDETQVDRVVNLLRRQGIEVHRSPDAVEIGDDSLPAGSYIIKLDQPYGRLARTLLERQEYPDANLRTYDDSAWTMGLMSNIEVQAVDDKGILGVAAELLAADVETRGRIDGSGAPAVYAVRHNGSLNLITLRYRLKDLAMRGATASFEAGDGVYPPGSFLIPVSDGQGGRIRSEIEELGLVAASLPAMPEVETVDLDLPRIAIYTTWSSTQSVGWVRLAFDRWEIPFDLIHKDHVRQGGLSGKYDVIVMPHQGQSGRSIVFEQPKLSRPLAYRKNDRFRSFGFYGETDDVRGGMGLSGAAEFARFVEEGGLLLTLGVASYFPTEFGIARLIEASRPSASFYAPGPIVQAEILVPDHPVMYGYEQETLPVRWAGGPLLQAPGHETPDGPSAATTVWVGPGRPAVLMQVQGGEDGVLSGHLRGANEVEHRPVIVDAPVGRGRVLIYANNPVYRWQTFGEHALVFNALLYYNDLPPPAGEPESETAGAEGNLLAAQRDERVDACGTPGGKPCRDERDAADEHGDGGERFRVGGADAEEQR